MIEWLPDWYINTIIFILGLLWGSFTNVVVARMPHGKSVVHPGSSCPGCGTAIRWYDNVPVLGYLMLRGRCRSCKTRISIQYPIVELLGGFLFLAVKLRFGLSWLLVIRDWPFVTILLAVTFIDLWHRIIPDKLSLGGLALGLATSWFVPDFSFVSSVLGAALGFGFFYAIALIYQMRSGRSGLGGGDIKLLAMIGAFLGPLGVLSTVLISSVTGSIVGIAWALIRARSKGEDQKHGRKNKKKSAVMGTAIPYGPFLVLGALYYYFLGDVLWSPFTIPT